MRKTAEKKPFKTVALIGRHDRAQLCAPLVALARCVRALGMAVIFEAGTACDIAAEVDSRACPLDAIGRQADVAIVLGGDGTMLGIGRQLAPYGTPLIGINGGRLGFMTDILQDDMLQVVPAMLKGAFECEQRTLLSVRTLHAGKVIHSALAFNDVVINRSGFAGMTELCVWVNGHLMYTQRSDGLIIATPTGSTAYALSVQGPILHPQLAGIVLVPIAPHTLSNRPIVLPDDSVLTIQMVSGRDVAVGFDMQSFTTLEFGDVIEVCRSPQVVSLLHPVDHSYYTTLRKKLHWHADYPSQENCHALPPVHS